MSPELRISVDLGTHTNACSYSIAAPETRPHTNQVHHVIFDKTFVTTPAMYAYGNGGKFLRGRELFRLVTQAGFPISKVIRFPKIAKYEIYADERLSLAYISAMDNYKKADGDYIDDIDLLYDVLDDILKIARAQIQDWARDKVDCRSPVVDWKQTLLLSVPVVWKPETNYILTNAAKRLGIPVQLVSEPCSAAAWILQSELENSVGWQKPPQGGDIFMVVDIGGGTVDITNYRFDDSVEDKIRAPFEVVGKPEGELCGGEFANEQFREQFEAWAQMTYGGIDVLASTHGETQEALLFKASEGFEKHKVSQSFPHDATYTITIRTTPPIYYELSVDDIRQCLDRVIDGTIRLIQKSILPNLRHIMIPGPIATNEYVQERIKQEFEPQGYTVHFYWSGTGSLNDTSPVARGALLRYPGLTMMPIQSSFVFGIAQKEFYDPRLHNDVKLVEQRDGFEKKKVLDPLKIEMHDGERWVKNRVVWLNLEASNARETERGSRTRSGRRSTTIGHGSPLRSRKGVARSRGSFREINQPEMIQEFDVTAGERITQTIYFTTNSKAKDHEPSHKDEFHLQDHIHKWSEIWLECDDKTLRRNGYLPDRRDVYHITCRFGLKETDMEKKLLWKIVDQNDEHAPWTEEDEIDLADTRWNPSQDAVKG